MINGVNAYRENQRYITLSTKPKSKYPFLNTRHPRDETRPIAKNIPKSDYSEYRKAFVKHVYNELNSLSSKDLSLRLKSLDKEIEEADQSESRIGRSKKEYVAMKDTLVSLLDMKEKSVNLSGKELSDYIKDNKKALNNLGDKYHMNFSMDFFA